MLSRIREHKKVGSSQSELSSPERGKAAVSSRRRLLAPNDMPTLLSDVRCWGDTVAKVENRSTLKISQKPMFRRLYRCGPSLRNVRNASAALKNFVRRPEKTFSTVSGPKRKTSARSEYFAF
jgi:hypothetical protein